MTDSVLQRAAAHTILPCEARGDTLVMAPGGDLAGYSRQEFVVEMNRVKELLKRPPRSATPPKNPNAPVPPRSFRNLIVDLSNSAYFGSEMIGHLVDLRQSVREDGVMAMSGLSSDMDAGLKVMKLDQMWMTFDTREEAVRAIAQEPLFSRLHHRWGKLLPWAAVAVALLVAYLILFTRLGYPIMGNPFEAEYAKALQYYDQYRESKGTGAGADEFDPKRESLLKRLTDYIDADRDVYEEWASERKLVHLALRSLRGSIANQNPRLAKEFVVTMQRARETAIERYELDVPEVPELPRSVVNDLAAREATEQAQQRAAREAARRQRKRTAPKVEPPAEPAPVEPAAVPDTAVRPEMATPAEATAAEPPAKTGDDAPKAEDATEKPKPVVREIEPVTAD